MPLALPELLIKAMEAEPETEPEAVVLAGAAQGQLEHPEQGTHQAGREWHHLLADRLLPVEVAEAVEAVPRMVFRAAQQEREAEERV